MSKYFYPAIFHKEQTGGYSVFIVDLAGCNTEGETLEEAYKMACDAIGLYLDGVKESDYPERSKPEEIKIEDGEFVSIIEFDRIAYEKKYNSKAVKKTLSIPAWLNELAEENHINFSGVLQSALKEKLMVNE